MHQTLVLEMYNFGHDHDASFIPFFYKGVLSGRLRLPKDFFIICNMVQVYPAQTCIVLWLRPRLRKEIKNDTSMTKIKISQWI